MKNAKDVLNTPETTPERFHRFRRRLGITQEELAGRCGVNTHTIREAEREPDDRSANVSLKSFERIEAYAGIPPRDWL
jgi:transcriptional regulator with XRE-family HTH domain